MTTTLEQVLAGVADRLCPAVQEVPDLSYAKWLPKYSPRMTWDWAHQLLVCEYLDKLTAGEIDRLMILMPPRHGKTELVTKRYGVYRLQRDPQTRVILAAYNQTLAETYSRGARRVARGVLSLSDERATAGDWETTTGGGIRAVGVGTGVTGHGGNGIIIDDPVKSREEADSETYRERLWDWYIADLFTRREPGAWQLFIGTPWHDDDLAARILASEDGANWVVLRLPAIAEEDDLLGRSVGEALCPERFDVDVLAGIKKVLGRNFTALYQLRPAPEEGAKFKRGDFRYYREIKALGFWRGEQVKRRYYVLGKDSGDERVDTETVWIVQMVDPALTAKDENDWFCLSTWGVTPKNDLILLDVYREHAETTEHDQIMLQQFRKWRPSAIGVESASYGLALFQRMEALGLPVIEVTAKGDKPARSESIRTRYVAHAVFHPAGLGWVVEIEDELLHFPVGKHDDFVDTASYAGIHLADRLLETDEQGIEEDIRTHPEVYPVEIAVEPDPRLAGGWY